VDGILVKQLSVNGVEQYGSVSVEEAIKHESTMVLTGEKVL